MQTRACFINLQSVPKGSLSRLDAGLECARCDGSALLNALPWTPCLSYPNLWWSHQLGRASLCTPEPLFAPTGPPEPKSSPAKASLSSLTTNSSLKPHPRLAGSRSGEQLMGSVTDRPQGD